MNVKQSEKIELSEEFKNYQGRVGLVVEGNYVAFSASNYNLKDKTPIEFFDEAYASLGQMIERLRAGEIKMPAPTKKWYEVWKK